MAVIVHNYVEPDFENLVEDENADCVNCLFSEKAMLVDGDEGYVCKARLYDVKTQACFVAK